MIEVRNDTPPAELTEGETKVFAVLEFSTEIGGHADIALPKRSAIALHRTLKELPLVLAAKKAELTAEELGDGHLSIDAVVGMPGFPPMSVAWCADHGLVLQMVRVDSSAHDIKHDGVDEDIHISMGVMEVAFGIVEPDEMATFLDNFEVVAEKAED